MNLRTIALTAALSLVAAPAIAGSTSNTIINGWERGSRKTNITNVRREHGQFNGETYNVKIDAVGERAGTNIRFDGKKFTGSGFATNVVNPDPFVNAGTVSYTESGSFSDVTNVNITEKAQFGNDSIQYVLDTNF